MRSKKPVDPLTPSFPDHSEEVLQIFINILSNAVQAMDGKGKIVARIQDSGPGIPQAHLSKIFDPFFTTKDPEEGTGLGLNIAHWLGRKYGGDINIESHEGQGATLSITFPCNG